VVIPTALSMSSGRLMIYEFSFCYFRWSVRHWLGRTYLDIDTTFPHRDRWRFRLELFGILYTKDRTSSIGRYTRR